MANEVLSILKLDNLKEEQMKSQIATFMKIAPHTFTKLKLLSKNIKDFQSQKERAGDLQKNKGREIGIGFNDDSDAQNFSRDAQGNVRRLRDQNDVKMAIVEEGFEEQLADVVLDVEGDQDEPEEFASNSNKARTPSQKKRRPRTAREEGIQSVVYKGGAIKEEEEEDEEQEEVQEEEEKFDRGREFLDQVLGTGKLEEQALGELVAILGKEDAGECQNELFSFLEDHEESLNGDVTAIKEVYNNREEIFFNISLELAQSNPEKMDQLIKKMKKSELGTSMLEQRAKASVKKSENEEDKVGQIILKSKEMKEILEKSSLLQSKLTKLEELDNETLAGLSKTTIRMKFKAKQSTALVGKHIKMPRGTTRMTEKGYEVVKIPAETKMGDFGITLKAVKDVIPAYMHRIFGKIEKLNKIQSEVFDSIFKSESNALICAPTGAGKTIIALLAILRVVNRHCVSDDPENPKINLEDFKIVYIAPMKALVNEIVATLRFRLNCLGVVVSEFTGDSHLSRKEVELSNILVCTPEKWDVATRKEDHKIPEDKLKLVIIDEVHLLNDGRGPVLETLVARLKERIREDEENNQCRMVGLSATLPNYQDVGKFLSVPNKSIFYFDGSFRPVPLSLEYVGITERKRFKQMMLTKEILYRKVMERVKHSQILIFVHSRKNCLRTGQELKEMAFADDLLSLFVGDLTESKQILRSQKDSFVNPDLAELIEYGIGIHHAGLERNDRNLVEDLFADKHLAVLISTATLAWGVNLPAKTVIIKNTQVYSPELGRWKELNMQDLLQMLGRAGRPFFDKEGEGIIITSSEELRMYLSLTNEQLPIESQLLVSLPEILNSEISLGNVTDLKTALTWINQTYFSLRLEQNPKFYDLKGNSSPTQTTFLKYKLDLIHSSAVHLEHFGMIRYDRNRGIFESTPEGKIASEFYIKCNTLKNFSENLTGDLTSIDLLRVFTLADEFQYVTNREEELPELEKLKSSVPFPVKGSLEQPQSKINILLQCYIGGVSLEGYALAADLVYISQNAQRLFRAMFQIALKKNLGQLSLRILEFCKMVEKRVWAAQSPLRQYMELPEKLFRRIEQQEQLTWDHFCSMTSEQLSVVIKNESLSRKIHKFLKLFPKLETHVYAQPVTRGQVKVQVDIEQQFQWNYELHGGSMFFWVFVLDVDEESLIFSEQICLKPKRKKVSFDFMVPLLEPLQPHYFIKVVSDNWLNCESSIPLLFTSLTLPKKFPAPTDIQSESMLSLFDLLQPKTKAPLDEAEQSARIMAAEFLFKNKIFVLNVLQSNLFDQFWNSFESLFVGANSNSGKFVMSLLSVIKLAVNDPERQSRVLLLFPDQTILAQKLPLISSLISVLDCSFHTFTGNVARDVKAFKKKENFLILSTPQNFDKFTRNPSKRAAQLQKIKQVILCQLESMNLPVGGVFETTLIRLRYLFFQMELNVRFVALGSSIANYSDVTDFLGIDSSLTFNAHPSILNNFINLLFYSFAAVDPTPRFVSMCRQFYRMLKINSFRSKLSLAYVDSLRSAKILLSNLIKHLAKDRISLNAGSLELKTIQSQVSDAYLQFFLEQGCAYLHDHQPVSLRKTLLKAFRLGHIRVLVITKGLFREISFDHKVDISVTFDSEFLTLMDHLTILGKNNRILYDPEALKTLTEDVDFSQSLVSQIGEMPFSDSLSNSLLVGENLKSIILSKSSRKDFLKRSLFEPIPVESRLLENLTEALNSEVVSKVVGGKQESLDWLTWSFLYRRITANPNFYGLSSRSSEDVSEFLSEIIENNVDDLEENGCVAVEDDVKLEADNLGVIASYYGIRIESIGLFSAAVRDGVSWEGLFKTFASLPELGNEDVTGLCRMNQELIKKMYEDTRFKFFNPSNPEAEVSFSSPDTGNNILFQLLLNRSSIPGEFWPHLRFMLQNTFNLIQGFIDSANVFQKLKPALLSMKFNQMLVQKTWFDDSNLLQLPHLSPQIVEEWKKRGVSTLDDFFELEDEDREAILKTFSPAQVDEIAEAANRYPSISLSASIVSEKVLFETEEPIQVQVEIERDNLDEDDPVVGDVESNNEFLGPKQEFWWVVIGDKGRNLLLSVKKVQFAVSLSKKFSIELAEEGEYNLSVFLICDSYLGCDNEIQDLKVKVIQQENAIQEEE